MKNEIYELKLHQQIRVNTLTTLIRVPGGWIYNFFNAGPYEDGRRIETLVQSVFVPFDNDLMER